MEPELFDFLSRLVKEENVFIDVGANVGIFSLLASDKVGPKGTVLTLEPNPATFGLMSELILANKRFNNLVFLQLAVSDQSGILPLQLNQDDSMLMERASIIHQEAGTKEVNVFTNTLDSLLPAGLKIDIIKIDVEGAELAALNGSKNIIREKRPMICVEVHGLYFPDPGKHVEEVFSFFESMNYKAINLHKGTTESARTFLEDSGVGGIDAVSGMNLRTTGYGNLIFVADETQEKFVKECLS